ncbi:MAG TPA: hypothetical protein VKA63_04685 [Candidatus Krumholzibacteria bacterium]|nr:hypothetical protein [Candidatus Krumholzibacteria bacterium]
MTKRNLSESLHLLANLGVIASIVFLGVELQQNNELMEMEARATLTEDLQDGWYQLSSDPGLVELFIKDRSGQELSEAEEMRLNAYWMGMLLRREWQHEHFPDAVTGMAGLQRLFSTYGSLRRAWGGTNSASRGAGKDNFSPEFVRFVETEVLPGS